MLAHVQNGSFGGVIIRSTSALFEARVLRNISLLGDFCQNVTLINWPRSIIASNPNLLKLKLNSQMPFPIQAKHGNGLRNLFSFLGFNFFIFLKLIKARPKIVWSCDADTFIPAAVYKLIFSCYLIFDQFDPISSRLKGSVARKTIQSFENLISNYADLRITANLERISDERRHLWIQWSNVFLQNRSFQSNNKKKQILYAGVLQDDRGIINLLEVSKLFEDVAFKIAGFGPLEEKVREFCSTSSNCTFLGRITHDEVLNESSCSIALWAFYDPRKLNNKFTASNKLSEAILCQTPILTNHGISLGEIVSTNRIGLVSDYSDLKQISNSVQEILEGREFCFDIVNLNELLKFSDGEKEICEKLHTYKEGYMP